MVWILNFKGVPIKVTPGRKKGNSRSKESHINDW